MIYLSSRQDGVHEPDSLPPDTPYGVRSLEGTVAGQSPHNAPPPRALAGIPCQLADDHHYPQPLPSPQLSQTSLQGGVINQLTSNTPPPPFGQGSSSDPDHHLGGGSITYVTSCLLNYIDQGINIQHAHHPAEKGHHHQGI